MTHFTTSYSILHYVLLPTKKKKVVTLAFPKPGGDNFATSHHKPINFQFESLFSGF